MHVACNASIDAISVISLTNSNSLVHKMRIVKLFLKELTNCLVCQYMLVFFMMRRNSASLTSPSPSLSASSIISWREGRREREGSKGGKERGREGGREREGRGREGRKEGREGERSRKGEGNGSMQQRSVCSTYVAVSQQVGHRTTLCKPYAVANQNPNKNICQSLSLSVQLSDNTLRAMPCEPGVLHR